MKKIMLVVALLVGSFCFADTWVADIWHDLNKEVTQEGTPEHIAVAYIRAFHAGDVDAVLKLCDEKRKKSFAKLNGMPFEKSLEKAKKWDLNKLFKGIKSGTDDVVVISIEYFDNRVNKNVNTPLKLILVDGKYRVTI